MPHLGDGGKVVLVLEDQTEVLELATRAEVVDSLDFLPQRSPDRRTEPPDPLRPAGPV